jgi:hypothetical protein
VRFYFHFFNLPLIKPALQSRILFLECAGHIFYFAPGFIQRTLNMSLPNPRPRGTLKPEQREKNRHLRTLRTTWPITRPNKISRGLRRRGNTCYLLSALQALLDLPNCMH